MASKNLFRTKEHEAAKVTENAHVLKAQRRVTHFSPLVSDKAALLKARRLNYLRALILQERAFMALTRTDKSFEDKYVYTPNNKDREDRLFAHKTLIEHDVNIKDFLIGDEQRDAYNTRLNNFAIEHEANRDLCDAFNTLRTYGIDNYLNDIKQDRSLEKQEHGKNSKITRGLHSLASFLRFCRPKCGTIPVLGVDAGIDPNAEVLEAELVQVEGEAKEAYGKRLGLRFAEKQPIDGAQIEVGGQNRPATVQSGVAGDNRLEIGGLGGRTLTINGAPTNTEEETRTTFFCSGTVNVSIYPPAGSRKSGDIAIVDGKPKNDKLNGGAGATDDSRPKRRHSF